MQLQEEKKVTDQLLLIFKNQDDQLSRTYNSHRMEARKEFIVSFQNCRTKGKDLQERKDQVEQPHEEGREFIT